jgi:PhoH-like ATPase
MSNRKILVLDTSVLLYDKEAIHSLPGNDIIIPLTVLDELDRFKEKKGLLGENARYVNRFLDTLREEGRLDEEIRLEENDQTIRVEIEGSNEIKIPEGLDAKHADNRILATALFLQKSNPGKVTKIITKDINLRVKSDALGLPAEDYYKDHIETDEIYTGETELYLSDKDVDHFFEYGKIEEPEIDIELLPNQFVLGKGGSGGSMLGIYRDNNISKLTQSEACKHVGIEPRNKEQKFALTLLSDPDIQLVTLTGIAGSGKTFLTLLSAMGHLGLENYKRIIFTRSIEPVGRDLGYLPGDMDEKMAPWLAPIVDNFRHAFGDTTYFECMRQKGQIDIAPLSYIRGRTFNDSFVIVDEAQNATIHELKTVITRIGHGSKVVLLGDTDQVDTPYIDSKSNGLSIIIEKFKDSSLAGHIRLSRGQRSDIATLASKIL